MENNLLNLKNQIGINITMSLGQTVGKLIDMPYIIFGNQDFIEIQRFQEKFEIQNPVFKGLEFPIRIGIIHITGFQIQQLLEQFN